MSWINVLWQDPEDVEGQLYDVILESGRRVIDCAYFNGAFHFHSDVSGWVKMDSTVTHFMPSPEPPKD